jgi:hypothetical protein
VATPGGDAAPSLAAAAEAAATGGGSVAAPPVTPAGLRAFVAQRNRQSEVAAAAVSVAAGHGVGDAFSKQQVCGLHGPVVVPVAGKLRWGWPE